jgi:putative Mg2+ transporter-C (MgtC) family protein
MDLWPYLGDVHAVLPPPLAGVAVVLTSVLCGTIVGLERQARDKPAGARTMMLIAVGSTIFTLASVLVAKDGDGDPGRIASQVVTGVGFLGAGAILRYRGHVRGLTTGATIWAVAAIGLLVGLGYAVAGVVLTLLVVSFLVLFRRHEARHDETTADGPP